jgi:acyl-CoA reductase-like NAD-dependent aldehyde dehydrogenase
MVILQVSLQTAKSLQAERAADQCRDLRAVLNLLIHITQSDLSGGDEDDNGLGQSVSMVAPAGVVAPFPACNFCVLVVTPLALGLGFLVSCTVHTAHHHATE